MWSCSNTLSARRQTQHCPGGWHVQKFKARLHDQSVTEVTHSILPNMGIKLLSFMSHWLQWVDGSLHISRSQLACSFHQRRMSVTSAPASQSWDYLSSISGINNVANTQCCAVNALSSTQCCAFIIMLLWAHNAVLLSMLLRAHNAAL